MITINGIDQDKQNAADLAALSQQLDATSATEGQVLTVQSDGSLAYADASGGALTINPAHVFADNTARDAYFVTNPTELVEEIFISVGVGFQQYLSSTWVDKTAVVLAELDTVTADNVDDTVITPLKNIIVNADLADLTTGWSDQYATLTESSGVLVVTQDPARTSFQVINTTDYTGVLADEIYVAFKYKISDLTGVSSFQTAFGGVAINLTQTAGEWVTFSYTYTIAAGAVGTNPQFKIVTTYASAVEAVLELKEIIAINLTSTFGTGSVDIESILAVYNGWFSDTVNLDIAKVSMIEDDTYIPATNVAYDVATLSGAVITVTGTGSAEYINTSMLSPNTLLGAKWMYASAKVKVVEAGCTKICLAYGEASAPLIIDTIENPVADTEYYLSGQTLRTLTSTASSRRVNVIAYYADAATQTGKNLVASKGIILALTDVFLTGNEPTTEDVDLMLSKFTDRWFAGTANLFSYRCLSLNGKMLKPTLNGAYLKINPDGHVEGHSAVNSSWTEWSYDQNSYGQNPTITPISHKFHGTIETDAMFSVVAKYGRWTAGASTSEWYNFGGHVFNAWNNIKTYRLTMIMGLDAREDEACIHVFSPTGAFAAPIGTLTEDQIANRIVQAQEDIFSGSAYFGRVRIGSDVVTEGFVFQKMKLTCFGNVELKGDNIQIDTTKTPASATATGVKGTICWDADYVYVCTATDTWKRAAISTWP